MKVKDLIENLQQYPEDTLLVVEGYEGGLNDIKEVEEVFVKLNAINSRPYGEHLETLFVKHSIVGEMWRLKNDLRSSNL
jgi:hypothetical protein